VNDTSLQIDKWMKSRTCLGFTLLEVMVVLTLILAVAAAAVPRIQSTVQHTRVEAALQMVALEMRRARQLAMDHRRVHTISFTTPRTVTIVRQETGGNPPTTVSELGFSPDVEFNRNSVSSNPDQMTSSAAIDFNGATSVRFNPDGSAVDASGQVCNGLVFVSRPGDPHSTAAVTLFGSTGRIRGFRFVQRNGVWGWK
jgi:prepilin-type N-terminal cleavage/methylation domain-containing protein